MRLTLTQRQAVRQRVGYACEFCGVAETDAGSELTIDHYHPRSKGGTDDLSNLVYCCPACNDYKHSYWVDSPRGPRLWNPRSESRSVHILDADDGKLVPLTEVGSVTVARLRLNRPALVSLRLRKLREADGARLFERCRELLTATQQLLEQQRLITQEQRELLGLQRHLLRHLSEGEQ